MSAGGSGAASTSSHLPNVVSVSAWYGSISCSIPTWRATSRFTLAVRGWDAAVACALRAPRLGGEGRGRRDPLCTAARHRGGEGEEVDVVRVVRERIDAHRVLPLDEHLVGVDGVVVGLGGVVPPGRP